MAMLRAKREPSLAELVGAVVSDTRDLLKQEIALARHELGVDLRKAKSAGISFGSAAVAVGVGLVLLSFMAVHLLQVAAGIPVWTAYGIVGGLYVVVGCVFAIIGAKRAASIELLRDTAQTTRENVQWIKEKTTSDRTWSEPAPR
jgi:hypothetical protein